MSPKRAATAVLKHRTNPDIPVRGDRMIANVFKQLCLLSNSAFALRAWESYQKGDYEALTRLEVNPADYDEQDTTEQFELDYQVACFFKKYQDFNIPGIDKEAAAFSKWLEAEASCRQTNEYLRQRWDGKTLPLSFPVEEVFHLARRKITSVLGSIKSVDLASIREGCRHGPGGDTLLRRSSASAYEKFRTTGAITEPCVRAFDHIFGGDAGDRDEVCQNRSLGFSDRRLDFANNAQIVDASKLIFVPKTARIDRAICAEPRWNVFLQLGIGDLISQRLRKVGQDIQCQARNQDAARRAISDGLSTVDLSSASDTISKNLVLELLADADPLWLDLILMTRCPYTMYKGKKYHLEKISSMGNGYTFPLETLIFYAFAWATTKFLKLDVSRVEVYGDDIIVPAGAFALLTETLVAFGFKVNASKSFATGNFYESCGKDFYKGREVRPFFVKKKVCNLSDAIVLHNQIVDWSNRNLPRGFYDSRRLRIATQFIEKDVPSEHRFYGPTSVGGVFHAPFDKWLPVKAKYGWDGWIVRGLSPMPIRRKAYSFWGHLYTKLLSDVDCSNWVTTPGSAGTTVRKILVPFTEDFILV